MELDFVKATSHVYNGGSVDEFKTSLLNNQSHCIAAFGLLHDTQ